MPFFLFFYKHWPYNQNDHHPMTIMCDCIICYKLYPQYISWKYAIARASAIVLAHVQMALNERATSTTAVNNKSADRKQSEREKRRIIYKIVAYVIKCSVFHMSRMSECCLCCSFAEFGSSYTIFSRSLYRTPYVCMYEKRPLCLISMSCALKLILALK